MRAACLFIVLSLIGAGPVWAGPKDDAATRLGVVEALIPRLEKQLEQNRDEAAKAAKDEAGTVEKVLTAQVQGVKDLFTLLVSALALVIGLAVLGGVMAYRNARADARDQAKQEMDRLSAKLTLALDQAKRDLEVATAELEHVNQVRCEAQENAVAAAQARQTAEDHSQRARDLVMGLEKLTPEEAAKADLALARAFPANTLVAHPTEELIPLARRALDLHRHDEADQALTTLVLRHPENTTGWLLQARLRMAQNRPAEALEAVAHARASTSDPYAMAAANSWQGDALLALGDRTGAVEAYEQTRMAMVTLVRARPNIPGYRRDLAVAWTDLGVVSQDREKADAAFAAAESELRQLTLSHGDVADYHRRLAGALRRRAGVSFDHDRRHDFLRQAEVALVQAKVLAPNDRTIHSDEIWLRAAWGDCHAASGDIDQARQIWTQAVADWQVMEDAGLLSWHGQRALTEYRAKLAGGDGSADFAPAKEK
ncbi:MAG: hypothetical protein HQL42_06875 [Alphaproteobacteria bacterium]|nr:hypothetical protein [Alphaproteobacteria bacterium]